MLLHIIIARLTISWTTRLVINDSSAYCLVDAFVSVPQSVVERIVPKSLFGPAPLDNKRRYLSLLVTNCDDRIGLERSPGWKIARQQRHTDH